MEAAHHLHPSLPKPIDQGWDKPAFLCGAGAQSQSAMIPPPPYIEITLGRYGSRVKSSSAHHENSGVAGEGLDKSGN